MRGADDHDAGAARPSVACPVPPSMLLLPPAQLRRRRARGCPRRAPRRSRRSPRRWPWPPASEARRPLALVRQPGARDRPYRGGRTPRLSRRARASRGASRGVRPPVMSRLACRGWRCRPWRCPAGVLARDAGGQGPGLSRVGSDPSQVGSDPGPGPLRAGVPGGVRPRARSVAGGRPRGVRPRARSVAGGPAGRATSGRLRILAAWSASSASRRVPCSW